MAPRLNEGSKTSSAKSENIISELSCSGLSCSELSGSALSGSALSCAPPEETLALIIKALEDAKVVDLVSIDLAGKTTLADYMVIASGTSNRHVGSAAEQVAEALAKAKMGSVRIEGLPQCDWVLLDHPDVIVHLFRPEVRSFYNLEKMWSAGRPSEMAPNQFRA